MNQNGGEPVSAPIEAGTYTASLQYLGKTISLSFTIKESGSEEEGMEFFRLGDYFEWPAGSNGTLPMTGFPTK